MILELYFDRPLLTRHFFEHESDEPLLFHDHDKSLNQTPTGPVLYLCRGPVATVFSELTYHHGPATPDLTPAEVDAVADSYHAHLRHWLLGGAPAQPGLVLTYEELMSEPDAALRPAVEFFAGSWDRARAAEARDRSTHAEVQTRNAYNPRIIDDNGAKQLRRDLFRYRHAPRLLARFQGDADLVAALGPALFELPGAPRPRAAAPEPAHARSA